ncbi:MAG: hypothetical protein R2685_04855 [Candidatus Nitrosocosmicus sp.]|nr:hypothetical protein [Candidatus Nitrosocosmicus sp.]
MSTDPSQDPVPYRKDLRKKMGLEGQDSASTNDPEEPSNNEDNNKSVE